MIETFSTSRMTGAIRSLIVVLGLASGICRSPK